MPKIKHKVTAFVASILACFMVTTPAMADMNGMDVSGWQNAYVTCNAPGDFAIVKATGGMSFTNPVWRTQADCTLNSGKKLGLYHYAGDGNTGSGTAEADRFVSVVAPYVGRAVLVLDWESQGNGAWLNSNWLREFVNRVHARTGVWPMVYTSAAYVWNIPSDVRANCGLWVAQYANMSATGYQSRPWNYGAAGEAMRQYTSNGWVGGYGPLDLNVFRGDRAAWDKYANPRGTSTPQPSTPSDNTDYNALADAVIRGDYGDGETRKARLGDKYDKVQSIVNQKLAGSYKPQTQTQTNTQRSISVTVRSGDTMSAIAARYNAWPVTAWKVPSGNVNRIWPGQVVTYNGGSSSVSTSVSRTVVVRSGDTLSGIAARLGISYTQLSGYRSGNPNVIYPGEVLRY